QQFPQVPDYEIWLGAYRNALAEALLRTGGIPDSREIEDTIARLERVLKEVPRLWFIHGLLAQSHIVQAQTLRKAHDETGAIAAEGRAEEERQAMNHRPLGKYP